MPALDLSTYDGLVVTIGDFLARDDLGDQIPAFIHLTEDKIRRRVRRNTITSQVALTTASFPLPADCAEFRGGRPITGSPSRDVPFNLVSAATLDELRTMYPTAGRPHFVAVVDNTLRMVPPPQSGTLAEIRYYEKLVPLSSANPTNSLLLEASDIYLYGALCEAAPYLKDDDRVALWESKFDRAVMDLDTDRQRKETAAPLARPRLPLVIG